MSDYKKIFDAITSDPQYQRNMNWGEARPGHPEGTVRARIVEVDQNLETLRAKVQRRIIGGSECSSRVKSQYESEIL